MCDVILWSMTHIHGATQYMSIREVCEYCNVLRDVHGVHIDMRNTCRHVNRAIIEVRDMAFPVNRADIEVRHMLQRVNWANIEMGDMLQHVNEPILKCVICFDM